MDENRNLINQAKKAMQNAYAPYSHFKVGAALLCEDGSVYLGCNVENISYGAAICAERTAIVKAVSDGKRSFKKLAIASSGEGKTFPCGICRQVINEFMQTGEVIVADGDNIEVYSVGELLPHSFDNEF